LLFLLSAWFGVVWLFRRNLPKPKLFLWLAAAAGVLSVVALEAGWVVTEVGRQPWIVVDYMKVTQGATSNEGVWITFLVVLGLYLGVATTLVLILRKMARGWREGGDDGPSGPYEPRGPRPTGLELDTGAGDGVGEREEVPA
jgi:cytochrome d ubiquinol oxidase subunit I